MTASPGADGLPVPSSHSPFLSFIQLVSLQHGSIRPHLSADPGVAGQDFEGISGFSRPTSQAPPSRCRNLRLCERRWAPLRGHRWCLRGRNNPSSRLLPQLLNVNRGVGELPNFPTRASKLPLSCFLKATEARSHRSHPERSVGALPRPGWASGSSWLSPHPSAPWCFVPNLLAACGPAAPLAPSRLLRVGTSSQAKRTARELVLCSSLQGCNGLQVL